MVLLGIRNEENRRSNMGRETHLVPVTWEREPFWWKENKILWPVVAPRSGRVQRHTPVPFAGTQQVRKLAFTDNFDSEMLKLAWNFRRVPMNKIYSLTTRKGYLRLYTNPQVIQERKSTSLIGFRQTESDFEYSTKMHFSPKNPASEAGIILYQKDNNFISFSLKKSNNGFELKAVHSSVLEDSRIVDSITTLGSAPITDAIDTIYLRLTSKSHQYILSYATNSGEYKTLATTGSDGVVSKKYTGANLGLYSTSEGVDTEDFADFDWVKYRAFER
jgi:alpha-N-arabinofuranosidase